MEFGSERSGHEVKDEKRSESSVGDEEDRREQEIVTQEPPLSTTERSTVEAGTNASSLNKKEEAVDELEAAKAKMGEVMEENQRLKTCLNGILNDYRTLQMQFHNIVEQETKDSSDQKVNNNNDHHQIEESDLVSLSLGRLPTRNNNKVPNNKPMKEEAEKEDKEGLSLGLDCKFEKSKFGIISTTEHLPNHQSPNNSVEEVPKEEAAGESWPPGKGHKTARDATVEDEVSQQNPAKKARVCVRTRCDTPTMNDGCQWRKYGQKISKGNPCPRAYYRCTVATSCPVRKQVQRCAQDMSILITTYEGNHNHPLSLSATAMASTTSAAASMLLSGSSTSHSGTRPSTAMTAAAATADLHGMNFFLSDGSKLSKQYYLSHPAALSSSPSHPTITLDLTSNNNPSSSSSAPLLKFTSNSNYNNTQRYPLSTSLNFSSSESNNAITSWSNNGFLSYNNTLPYNSNRNVTNVLSNINLGTQQQQQPMENIYNSYMQRNNNIPMSPPQHSLPDTIAAATKVITADPNFQSALAAALTTIIGSGSPTQGNHGAVGENLSQKMKWGELFPSSSSALPSSSTKVNGCASSFLNKSAANTQPGTAVMFLQPPLPLSSPKSASGSPGDHRDKRN